MVSAVTQLVKVGRSLSTNLVYTLFLLKLIIHFVLTVSNLGAVDIGYSAAAKAMFAKGSFDLIDFFYKRCNQQLADYLKKLIIEGQLTKKNELIREAIIFRLTLIQPYLDHWPQVRF